MTSGWAQAVEKGQVCRQATTATAADSDCCLQLSGFHAPYCQCLPASHFAKRQQVTGIRSHSIMLTGSSMYPRKACSHCAPMAPSTTL